MSGDRIGHDDHVYRHGTLLVPGLDSNNDDFGLSCFWVREACDRDADGGLYIEGNLAMLSETGAFGSMRKIARVEGAVATDEW